MKPVTVDPELIDRFPSIADVAASLEQVLAKYREIPYPPLAKGASDCRAVARRCRAIATANLLRGEELLSFALSAINHGALLTAHVLTRALDETLAAVVGSQRKIQKAIDSGNEEQLTETLNRLTCGNRYMSERDEHYPRSYNVLDLVDETTDYLDDLVPPDGGRRPGEFRTQYEFLSEFVHPSQGSFAIYQRPEGGKMVFDRKLALTVKTIQFLLANLRMAAYSLLTNAEALSSIPDLPETWPQDAGTRTAPA